jgi:nitroimidazol reductase NimA-like FMN-containing flavoprotein (pyridoxamine 5'-phosphate oxidase superfamily)
MSSEAVRSIVAANTYMTLATADEHGNPWASPVWYATADWREFVWVSAPEARHSQNLARRPVLAIVIFDSRQPPGTGEAVYLRARAEPVPEPERALPSHLRDGVGAQGLADWKRADVEPPARLRLYRAIATEHFILSAGDERISVGLSP